MTRPRCQIVCVEETPYYHLISRCVRRSFLCGFDHHTQTDYEHRRHWIEARIHILASIFAVDICSYAVMSNHYHIVAKLCPQQVDTWSNEDVVERWLHLFKGPLILQQFNQGKLLVPAEQEMALRTIAIWRKRLQDLGWFMKCLNEPIARIANKEDQCKGHFWEARYKSHGLTSEAALLSCMAYVDLNPVRAGIAPAPETSDFTSVKHRLKPCILFKKAIEQQIEEAALQRFNVPLKPLLHFDGNETNSVQVGLPFAWSDYLKLVDWTGRVVRPDKRYAIEGTLPAILKRLEINPQDWALNVTQFEMRHCWAFKHALGWDNTG